jgi:hypothetical protein
MDSFGSLGKALDGDGGGGGNNLFAVKTDGKATPALAFGAPTGGGGLFGATTAGAPAALSFGGGLFGATAEGKAAPPLSFGAPAGEGGVGLFGATADGKAAPLLFGGSGGGGLFGAKTDDAAAFSLAGTGGANLFAGTTASAGAAAATSPVSTGVGVTAAKSDGKAAPALFSGGSNLFGASTTPAPAPAASISPVSGEKPANTGALLKFEGGKWVKIGTGLVTITAHPTAPMLAVALSGGGTPWSEPVNLTHPPVVLQYKEDEKGTVLTGCKIFKILHSRILSELTTWYLVASS